MARIDDRHARATRIPPHHYCKLGLCWREEDGYTHRAGKASASHIQRYSRKLMLDRDQGDT